jgi:hypothetical protein
VSGAVPKWLDGGGRRARGGRGGGEGRRRRDRWKGRGSWRLGTGPTGGARLPVAVREGEGVGPRGELGRELSWAAREKNKKRKKRKTGGGLGWKEGEGRVFVVFSFFLFFFKSISNPFKFKSFTSFQIQILTQISPIILKAFHKPFLTTFQTFLNSNFHFCFYQTFTQIFNNFSQLFLRTYSQIFLKTFKIAPQPKLMHFNMMHKHLIDSNY